MATIEFACPHCQQSLDAPEEYAGATVECPACHQEFTIQAREATPLPCPSCAVPMEPGAVLCVHCGYHLKLQKRIQTNFG